MESSGTHRVTQLLEGARGGDAAASRDLLPIVYHELRRLAESRMAGQPKRGAGQTLQPTALVHEAYLRLVEPGNGEEVKWANRRHFFAAAATAMRDILVDQARQRASLKRGGDREKLEFEPGAELESEPESCGVDLIALDGALSRLAARDARKVEIVMLRYFAGLSVEETARSMDLSPATVKREWGFAKALLYDDLKHGVGESA